MDRRLSILGFTPEFLLEMLKPGRHAWEVYANPLPEDVRVLQMTYDASRATFYLLLESEAFPPVTEGNSVPHLPSTVLHELPPPPAEE